MADVCTDQKPIASEFIDKGDDTRWTCWQPVKLHQNGLAERKLDIQGTSAGNYRLCTGEIDSQLHRNIYRLTKPKVFSICFFGRTALG